MKLGRLFALAALLPAMLNAAPAVAGRGLLTPVCTGDGLVHMVRTPLNAPKLPGSDQTGCCAKGCHAASSRKRASAKQ